MTGYTIGRDVNGNRIVKVRPNGWRGFSIQTNGQLHKTHAQGVGDWTPGEVAAYVREVGTPRQRAALDVTK